MGRGQEDSEEQGRVDPVKNVCCVEKKEYSGYQLLDSNFITIIKKQANTRSSPVL